MTNIFISYSRKDQSFASRLATSLCLLGADVWIDLEDIPAGVKWSTAIQEGLNRCDVMIIVLSPDSMASTNVEDEWQYFLDRRKPIVPVLLRPTQIHFQLNRLQYIDFHTLEYDAALNELHDELLRKGFTFSSTPAEIRGKTLPPPLPAPVRRPQSRLWIAGLAAAALLIVVVALVLSSLANRNGAGSEVTLTPTTEAVAALPTDAPAATDESTPVLIRTLGSLAGQFAPPSSTLPPGLVIIPGDIRPLPAASAEAEATESLGRVPNPIGTLALGMMETPSATTSEPDNAAPTDTPDIPEPTPTDTPDIPVPTPTNTPDNATIVLIYDSGDLVIFNRSSRLVNLNGISFVQRLPNGNERTFRLDLFTEFSTGILPAGQCLHLWTLEAGFQSVPDYCTHRVAWRALGEGRWFWGSDEPDAAFEVRRSGDVLATCPIAEEECALGL
jgi:hypothetical protein